MLLSIFSCTCWPFVCLLWKNVYLGPLSILSIYLSIYLFIYWLCWVFVFARGLSLVAVSGGHSSLWCAGFLLQWLLLLRNTGSRHTDFSSCGSRALERRLSSCGAWAQLLRGMWDLPGPGIEPVSPALAGRFLTTAPTGKPPLCPFLNWIIWFFAIELYTFLIYFRYPLSDIRLQIFSPIP